MIATMEVVRRRGRVAMPEFQTCLREVLAPRPVHSSYWGPRDAKARICRGAMVRDGRGSVQPLLAVSANCGEPLVQGGERPRDASSQGNPVASIGGTRVTCSRSSFPHRRNERTTNSRFYSLILRSHCHATYQPSRIGVVRLAGDRAVLFWLAESATSTCTCCQPEPALRA